MARKSKKVISAATREEAESAMATVACCNSQLKKIEAEIELEKQRIDNKFKDQIVKLQEKIEEPMEVLEVYAKQESANWEGRSFDLAHGTIGFRTNTPKVEKNKKFTWDSVVELLQKYFPELVRTKYEANKEAIIAMRDEADFEKVKNKCFINVVQDESFFVKTKEEELAPV